MFKKSGVSKNKTSNKIINIPNIISFSRLFLIIPLIFAILYWKNKWITISVIGLSIFTDYLDGYFARKLKQATRFGEVWDSVCDKIFWLSLMIILIVSTDFPLVVLILVLLREALLLLGNLIISRGFPMVVVPSIFIGKVYINFLASAVIIYILELNTLFLIATIIAFTLAFLSLPFYFMNIYRKSKGDENLFR
jgi:CDP-diacylglycerol--glycerol-3-phosphate 3-phosphatidyltransferase